MPRIISAYQIVDHGIEHEQYFQGCGVSYTEYEDCYTGIGQTLWEALDDALDIMATEEKYEYNSNPELIAEIDNANNVVSYDVDWEDHWYYASIRVR